MEITNEAQKGYIIKITIPIEVSLFLNISIEVSLFLNISIEIKFYFTFLVVK